MRARAGLATCKLFFLILFLRAPGNLVLTKESLTPHLMESRIASVALTFVKAKFFHKIAKG